MFECAGSIEDYLSDASDSDCSSLIEEDIFEEHLLPRKAETLQTAAIEEDKVKENPDYQPSNPKLPSVVLEQPDAHKKNIAGFEYHSPFGSCAQIWGKNGRSMQNWIETQLASNNLYAMAKHDGQFKMFNGTNLLMTKNNKPLYYSYKLAQSQIEEPAEESVVNDEESESEEEEEDDEEQAADKTKGKKEHTKKKSKKQGTYDFTVGMHRDNPEYKKILEVQRPIAQQKKMELKDHMQQVRKDWDTTTKGTKGKFPPSKLYNINVKRQYCKSVIGYMKRLCSLVEDEYITQLKTLINKTKTQIENRKKKYGEASPGLENDIQTVIKEIEIHQEKKALLQQHGKGLLCDEDNITDEYWENCSPRENEKVELKNIHNIFPTHFDVVLFCEFLLLKRSADCTCSDKYCKCAKAAPQTENILTKDLPKQKDWVQQLYHYGENDRQELWYHLKSFQGHTANNRFFSVYKKDDIDFTNKKSNAIEDAPIFWTEAQKKNKQASLYNNKLDNLAIHYKVFDMYPNFNQRNECQKFMLPFIQRLQIVDLCITKLNNMIIAKMQRDQSIVWYRLPIVNMQVTLPIQIQTFDEYVQLSKDVFDKNQEGMILCSCSINSRNNIEHPEEKKKSKYLFDLQVSLLPPEENPETFLHNQVRMNPITNQEKNTLHWHAAVEAKSPQILIHLNDQQKTIPAWQYIGPWVASQNKLETKQRLYNFGGRTVQSYYSDFFHHLLKEYEALNKGKSDKNEIRPLLNVWIRCTTWDSCNFHRVKNGQIDPKPRTIRDFWVIRQKKNKDDNRIRVLRDKDKDETDICDHDNLWLNEQELANWINIDKKNKTRVDDKWLHDHVKKVPGQDILEDNIQNEREGGMGDSENDEEDGMGDPISADENEGENGMRDSGDIEDAEQRRQGAKRQLEAARENPAKHKKLTKKRKQSEDVTKNSVVITPPQLQPTNTTNIKGQEIKRMPAKSLPGVDSASDVQDTDTEEQAKLSQELKEKMKENESKMKRMPAKSLPGVDSASDVQDTDTEEQAKLSQELKEKMKEYESKMKENESKMKENESKMKEYESKMKEYESKMKEYESKQKKSMSDLETLKNLQSELRSEMQKLDTVDNLKLFLEQNKQQTFKTLEDFEKLSAKNGKPFFSIKLQWWKAYKLDYKQQKNTAEIPKDTNNQISHIFDNWMETLLRIFSEQDGDFSLDTEFKNFFIEKTLLYFQNPVNLTQKTIESSTPQVGKKRSNWVLDLFSKKSKVETPNNAWQEFENQLQSQFPRESYNGVAYNNLLPYQKEGFKNRFINEYKKHSDNNEIQKLKDNIIKQVEELLKDADTVKKNVQKQNESKWLPWSQFLDGDVIHTTSQLLEEKLSLQENAYFLFL